MLSGVRVLDLSWVLGGPFGGQTLAQLGAEVIKIEPMDGDMSRTIPPYFFEQDSSFFLSANRGKKSIALDLKKSEGLAALHDLVRQSHAVIYGFAPNVPEKLGIDFNTLKSINPKIVVGQLIGFHDAPPYSNAPAFDLIVQALGGFMSITGEHEGKPVRAGYQIADLAGGLYLALATLGALLSATLNGKGRSVQISLLDCQLALLTWQAQNYFISGDIPQAHGSRHPMIAPSESFLCADGKPLVISPTGDAFWNKFCNAIGRPDLANDPRFTSSADRIKNVDMLAQVLTELFRLKNRDQWTAELFDARIPAAPVLNVAEALSQPLTALRSMVETLSHPESGNDIEFLGNPFKYENAESLCYPPQLGADTDEILTRLCGYNEAKLTFLKSKGAIFKQGEKL
ncbi:MAG: CaiB/BaiF CoA transferase family protein [Advenella sp.]|uniref:Carnitine dehydratase n=1 Tax=Advenella kashmirensis TaxID=310575 RepID=A0A356LAD6_9BURK|nr:CoA transferase [Advenella sp. FME57]HBP27966.1 carnitine dehydratase [Advenella kashmirensis]